jgi:drug/metabolite transporter (DMT)-like permease
MQSSTTPSGPRSFWIGTLCYLNAAFVWGLNIPLTSALFASFDPFWLAPLRLSIASCLLAMAVLLSLGSASLKSPIPAGRVLLMSLCVSCFFTLYNLGLLHSNTITAAAIMAGSPVYGAVTTRLMTGAKLEKGFWGAALLTMIGASIAIYGRSERNDQGLMLEGGEILIVLSIAAWTAYSILSQRWFPTDVPQLQRTFLTTLGSIPCLLVFWLIAWSSGVVGAPNFHPSAEALRNLFITAAFSTALGAVTWNIGVARLGINAGVMWQNTVPVFAVLISLVAFQVQPMPEQMLGGCVVLSGVLYMQWHKLRLSRAPNQT